jgi:hypothetical protein
MAGYRFCRSDDAQRLVEGYNTCYRVHFRDEPELTLDGFKRWVRELQVWASSCMIASGDRGEPIQSLSSKLAILGPPRIVAEVPDKLRAAKACFESCGFLAQATYTDFMLENDGRIGDTDAHHPLISPIRLDDAMDAGLLDRRKNPVCWTRWPEGMVARKGRLHGLAVASEAQIEAAMLYSVDECAPEECQINLVHVADPRAGEKLLRLMLDDLRRDRGRFVFRRVHPAEVAFELLDRLGFRPRGAISGYGLDRTV